MAIILALLLVSTLCREHKYIKHEHYELAKAFNIIALVVAILVMVSPFASLVFVRPRLHLTYYKILSICDFIAIMISGICGFISYWSTNDPDDSLSGRVAFIPGVILAAVFFILMNGWWFSNWIG